MLRGNRSPFVQMAGPLASYRDTMRRRGAQARREQERRRRRARKTARRVAEYLRHAYGAARVVLFGSMAGDEVRYEFDEAMIDVPSRFDRASPTATWRFDGTLTVRVNHVDE